ncbi:MAG: hypothetical protein MJ102_04240 [Clostridia bacterium]|nr:hypothetical protein [Clostridia bacterium]
MKKIKKFFGKIKNAFWRVIYNKKPVKYARKKGVTVGEKCTFIGHPNFGSEPYLVSVGNRTLISFDCAFVTHDGAVSTVKARTGKKDL